MRWRICMSAFNCRSKTVLHHGRKVRLGLRSPRQRRGGDTQQNRAVASPQAPLPKWKPELQFRWRFGASERRGPVKARYPTGNHQVPPAGKCTQRHIWNASPPGAAWAGGSRAARTSSPAGMSGGPLAWLCWAKGSTQGNTSLGENFWWLSNLNALHTESPNELSCLHG